jgi:HNH endonuclease
MKARDGRLELVHRLVWIDAHGPIPRGYVIHHRNGNSRDNRLANLELLTRAAHNARHCWPQRKRHRRRHAPQRPVRLCSMDGCTRRHSAKGLCRPHYRMTIGFYLRKTHNGRRDAVHRIVWMLAHGPIPKDSVIHHRNGDGRDNRLENLELLTRAEHRRLHTLTRPK